MWDLSVKDQGIKEGVLPEADECGMEAKIESWRPDIV